MTRKDNSEALSKRQAALINVMASFPYPNRTEAARQLEIPPDTANRWGIDPHFKSALADAYAADEVEVKTQLGQKIKGASESALAVKVRHLQNKDPQIRRQESTWLLERFLGKDPQLVDVTSDGKRLASTVVFMLPEKDPPPDPGMPPETAA